MLFPLVPFGTFLLLLLPLCRGVVLRASGPDCYVHSGSWPGSCSCVLMCVLCCFAVLVLAWLVMHSGSWTLLCMSREAYAMPVHHVYVLMFESFKQTLNQTKHNQQCADAVAVHVSDVPLLVMVVWVLIFYCVRILSQRRVGGSSSPF